MGPSTPGEVRGSCGQDLTCLLASGSPGSLQGHRQPQAQQRVPPADFSMQIFGGPKAFLQGFISKGWKEPFWRHSGGRAPRGSRNLPFSPLSPCSCLPILIFCSPLQGDDNGPRTDQPHGR